MFGKQDIARGLVAALAGMAALALVAGASAQPPDAAPGGGVEVRVWQKLVDADLFYVSAHPAGGPWADAPLPLALDGLTTDGAWRYGDAVLDVAPRSVELRVWRGADGGGRLYLSARLAGGSWRTLGTVPLAMDGRSGTGAFRYGGVTLGAAPAREPFRLGFLDIGLVDHFISNVPDEGPAYRAALLAVKHVNDAGGVFGQPVEAFFGDSGLLAGETSACPSCQRTAVELAELLIEVEGVHAFVGPVASTDLIAIAREVAAPRRVPFISPVSSSPFAADHDEAGFIFRTSVSDAAQGYALAELARDEGHDHVALVHRDDAWGRALAAAFMGHYEGRVSAVALHPDADSFSGELRELAASDAPALVVLTWPDDAVAVLDEVVAEGHFGQFFLINDHRPLIARYPGTLDGALGVAPRGLHVSEAEGHWEADYAAAYGAAPDAPFTRETYDAAIALMLAAEYAGSADGEAIRDALHAIATPPGARHPASAAGVAAALAAIRAGEDIDLDGESTPLDWDERGEIARVHMGIWRVTDGAIEDLRSFVVTLD